MTDLGINLGRANRPPQLAASFVCGCAAFRYFSPRNALIFGQPRQMGAGWPLFIFEIPAAELMSDKSE